MFPAACLPSTLQNENWAVPHKITDRRRFARLDLLSKQQSSTCAQGTRYTEWMAWPSSPWAQLQGCHSSRIHRKSGGTGDINVYVPETLCKGMGVDTCATSNPLSLFIHALRAYMSEGLLRKVSRLLDKLIKNCLSGSFVCSFQ
jgi:hypothetical protein